MPRTPRSFARPLAHLKTLAGLPSRTALLAAFCASVIPAATLPVSAASLTAGQGQNHAAILIYHRFGEDTIPSTNVRLEQFEAHLDALESGGYTVLPLADIVSALKAGTPLPERAVAITVDDAYQSAALEAWPRLKARGWPMTLFISTDEIGNTAGTYMTWETVRQLESEGVTIGHHGDAHIHMPSSGLDASIADLDRADAVFERELGYIPTLFAYPYGEYDPATADMLRARGFTAALAQYSGPASTLSDSYALPRFAFNEAYSDTDRFTLLASSLPLPVVSSTPTSPVVSAQGEGSKSESKGAGQNPPVFSLTLKASEGVPLPANIKQLTCYPSHMGTALPLHATENADGTLTLTATNLAPLPKGRSRINCTLPAGGGQFYWYGASFLVKGAEE